MEYFEGPIIFGATVFRLNNLRPVMSKKVTDKLVPVLN
jgi:hypothetical protein